MFNENPVQSNKFDIHFWLPFEYFDKKNSLLPNVEVFLFAMNYRTRHEYLPSSTCVESEKFSIRLKSTFHPRRSFFSQTHKNTYMYVLRRIPSWNKLRSSAAMLNFVRYSNLWLLVIHFKFIDALRAVGTQIAENRFSLCSTESVEVRLVTRVDGINNCSTETYLLFPPRGCC